MRNHGRNALIYGLSAQSFGNEEILKDYHVNIVCVQLNKLCKQHKVLQFVRGHNVLCQAGALPKCSSKSINSISKGGAVRTTGGQ